MFTRARSTSSARAQYAVLSPYALGFVWIVLVVLFLLGPLAASSPGGLRYTTTEYAFVDGRCFFQVDPSIAGKGEAWVDACRRAAASWSNMLSPDVGRYGLKALPYNFYFQWQPYDGRPYRNTLGFGNVGDYLAMTQREGEIPPCRSGEDFWYIRFSNEPGTFSLNIPGVWGYYCFQSVATHELGHAAGLHHPEAGEEFWDDTTKPTMFESFFIGEYWGRTLAPADKEGMRVMYGYF